MTPDHAYEATSNTNLRCRTCRLPEGMRKHTAADIVTPGGTTYGGRTPDRVVTILEQARLQRTARLVLHYGDIDSGQAWGDTETGYIGRSMGPVKVPLVIPNSRSTGGGAILDHCIVKIETARGKQVLWQHPTYTPATED